MNESEFNVLLYSDESQSTFFAIVYSAMLLMNMPNMHLNVVQLKDSDDGLKITINDWINSWHIKLTPNWMKDVWGGIDSNARTRYLDIISKTNEIFSKRVVAVSHQVRYCNPNIPDTVEALLEYATKNSIELIVLGAEEQTTLKDLIFGSLPKTLQKKSSIPVVLVNKLPQDFLDSYRSKQPLKVIGKDCRY